MFRSREINFSHCKPLRLLTFSVHCQVALNEISLSVMRRLLSACCLSVQLLRVRGVGGGGTKINLYISVSLAAGVEILHEVQVATMDEDEKKQREALGRA